MFFYWPVTSVSNQISPDWHYNAARKVAEAGICASSPHPGYLPGIINPKVRIEIQSGQPQPLAVIL